MKNETIHLYVNLPGSHPCYDTISAALAELAFVEPGKAYPAPVTDLPSVILHIGAGVYREKLVITRPNLTLQGEGESREDVVLVYGDAALDIMPEGDKRGTFRTASVRIDTHDFTARHLTFQNDAGYGHTVGQALALYVDGDRNYFEDCCLLGSQDTLFTAPLPVKEAQPGGFKGPGELLPRTPGRHCYRDCYIRGDVDFIFGGAVAWFENCTIFSGFPQDRKAESAGSSQALPQDRKAESAGSSQDCSKETTARNVIYGYVTAASTPREQKFGYVFSNCSLESDCPPRTVMLGRPWREWAKTVFLNCRLGEHIHPAGWNDWNKPHGHFFYGEYKSYGPGASPETRADFSCQLSNDEAAEYTMENVLNHWKPGN